MCPLKVSFRQSSRSPCHSLTSGLPEVHLGSNARTPASLNAAQAALFCRDFSRDFVSDFATNPEWQLEVTDEAGKALFRFRFVAETL
jgi:hypothetical protein